MLGVLGQVTTLPFAWDMAHAVSVRWVLQCSDIVTPKTPCSVASSELSSFLIMTLCGGHVHFLDLRSVPPGLGHPFPMAVHVDKTAGR